MAIGSMQLSHIPSLPWLLLIGAISITSGCMQNSKQHMGMGHEAEPCKFTPSLSVHCGRTPTSAYDQGGRLWVSYVVGKHVYLTWSDNRGENFSDPVKVNVVAEEIYTNGENRPKIAFGRNQEIYISWTAVRDGPFYGDIRFARSVDGGRNFGPVTTVNDDGLLTSHRFETLFVDSQGNIFLAWLDKRDLVASNTRGEEYNGAAVYYTVSTDNGVRFSENRKLSDYSCECCRIAMSETPDGDVAMFWRQIFGDNIRDHGFGIVGLNGIVQPLKRATDDNWHIEACPHHGPAMTTGHDGTYHMTWFTLGETRKGIFYGRHDPETAVMSDFLTVAGSGSSHPHILRHENELYLVWKQFDGEKTNIMLMYSATAGSTWAAPVPLASTMDASDHPLLINRDQGVWLSWHSSAEGLRIIPVHQHEAGQL